MPQTTQRSSIAVCFLSLLGSSFAQSLPDPIVGCDVVDCPITEGTAMANCTLVEKYYTGIGLARIPFNTSSPLYGLSWVEGVNVTNQSLGRKDDDRFFEKNFYLGTPSNLDLSDLDSCAIFFPNTTARFPGDLEESVGTCENAMSSECVKALNTRAREVDISNLNPDEACSKVRKELEGNFDSVCADFTRNSTWLNTTAKVLSGSQAPEPISSSENSTSNCWPITPKSDSLTLIESIETKGDYGLGSVANNLPKVIPILTVFFPGNSSIISEAQSQMTCLKILPQNTANEKTKSSGENFAATLLPNIGLLGISVLLALVVLE